MKGWHTLAATAFLFCGAMSAFAIEGEVSEALPKQPSVLFLSRKIDPTFRTMLESDGFVVHEGRPGVALELTWDLLKQFNALVLVEWHPFVHNRTDFSEAPEVFDRISAPAIRRFLQEGGGIFANCAGAFGGTEPMYAAAQISMMKAWGAALTPQSVYDSSTERIAGGYGISYLFTDQISDSPVSEDVSGLWLQQGGKGSSETQGTLKPIIFGSNWTVVVRGGESAISKPFNIDTPSLAQEFTGDPVFSTRPPLFGIRQYGNGRLAAEAIGGLGGYAAGYFHLVGGIQMEKGIGNQPSHYARLVRNTLRWLAEPSLQSGALGGFIPPAKPSRSGPPEVYAQRFDWDQLYFRPDYPNNYRGVIGLTSAHGGGKATVREYAEEARRLGLDFICFLDPVERLDAASWEALKNDCRAAEDGTLTVYPGLRYRDELGNHRFLLADYIPWPEPFLTADKRMKFRTEGAYLFLQYGYPVMGIHKTSANPHPVWNQRLLNSLAVTTYENGIQVDNGFEDYLDSTWNFQDLTPYCVDIVDSPEGLRHALEKGHDLNVIQGNTLEDVRKFFGSDRGRGYTAFAYKHVSSGPVITAWHILNDVRATGGDRWMPGSQRVRARIRVASKQPLTQVLLYNGSRVIRRFDAEGRLSFAQDVELAHVNQPGYVVVAEDVQGGRAISDPRVTRDFLMYDLYCGDRVNSIPLGWLRAPNGDVIYHNFPTMVHGPLTDTLLPGVEKQAFCPPGDYIDTIGMAGPNGILLHVETTQGSEPGWAPNRKIGRLLTSADALVKTGTVRHKYARPVTNGWMPDHELVPMEYVDMDYTLTWFAYRLFGQATGILDCSIRFKQDVTLKQAISVFYLSHHRKVQAGLYDHFCIVTPEHVHAGKVPDPGQPAFHAGGDIPPTAYISLFPSVYGSSTVYALSDNLHYYYGGGDERSRAELRIGNAGQTVKKGTTWTFRLLGLRGQSGLPAHNSEAEEFRHFFFGTNGAKGYEIVATQGRVEDSLFPIELTAEAGCFAGSFTQARIPGIDLPLVVGGFGESWSVVLYDTAKKRLRQLGVVEDRAFCALDTRQVRDFVVGYPVTASVADLTLTLIEAGQGRYGVEVHNPTERDIQCVIKIASWWDEVQPVEKPVLIGAMSSTVVALSGTFNLASE